MIKHYEMHAVKGKTFYFKLDLNPISNEYVPHIWARHTVEPYQVIAAYFNQSKINFNEKRNRFEAFSKTDNLNIWFNYKGNKKSEIIIITAFRI